MSPEPLPDFLPVLPEMFLGGEAMALLLLGVFQGDRAAREIAWLGGRRAADRARPGPAPLARTAPRARSRSTACS